MQILYSIQARSIITLLIEIAHNNNFTWWSPSTLHLTQNFSKNHQIASFEKFIQLFAGFHHFKKRWKNCDSYNIEYDDVALKRVEIDDSTIMSCALCTSQLCWCWSWISISMYLLNNYYLELGLFFFLSFNFISVCVCVLTHYDWNVNDSFKLCKHFFFRRKKVNVSPISLYHLLSFSFSLFEKKNENRKKHFFSNYYSCYDGYGINNRLFAVYIKHTHSHIYI